MRVGVSDSSKYLPRCCCCCSCSCVLSPSACNVSLEGRVCFTNGPSLPSHGPASSKRQAHDVRQFAASDGDDVSCPWLPSAHGPPTRSPACLETHALGKPFSFFMVNLNNSFQHQLFSTKQVWRKFCFCRRRAGGRWNPEHWLIGEGLPRKCTCPIQMAGTYLG